MSRADLDDMDAMASMLHDISDLLLDSPEQVSLRARILSTYGEALLRR